MTAQLVRPQRRHRAAVGVDDEVLGHRVAGRRPGDPERDVVGLAGQVPAGPWLGVGFSRTPETRRPAGTRRLPVRCPSRTSRPVSTSGLGVDVEAEPVGAVPPCADRAGGAAPGVRGARVADGRGLVDVVVHRAAGGDAVVRRLDLEVPRRTARRQRVEVDGDDEAGPVVRRVAAGRPRRWPRGAPRPRSGRRAGRRPRRPARRAASAVRPVSGSARSTAQPVISTRPGDQTMCWTTPWKWLSRGESRSTRSGCPWRKARSGSSGSHGDDATVARLGTRHEADVLEVGVRPADVLPPPLRDQLRPDLLAHGHEVERAVGGATEVGLEGGRQDVAVAVRGVHGVGDERREVDLEGASDPGVVDEVGRLRGQQLVRLLLHRDPVEAGSPAGPSAARWR